MLELQGIEKSFGSHLAVKRLDLQIAEGEFFSLLGPSGCGKTTLLRMLGGFESPSAGQILHEGRRLDVLPSNQRPFNMVFQRYALFPHLHVWDNVAFGLKMKKVPDPELRSRVSEMLALVKLDGMERRSISTLSGGQQQRVALARALINRPKVLLLDEPLSALDLKLRQQMQVELKAIQRRLGHTFIFVTHDQEEALTLSDRVAVMNHGQIEQVGTPQEIYDHPKTPFVARFIGSINVFSGKIASVLESAVGSADEPGGEVSYRLLPDGVGVGTNGFEVRQKRGALSQPKWIQGQAASVLIRPEKIRIEPLSTDSPQALWNSRGNRIQGSLKEILFQGAITQYLVESDAFPGNVLIASRPNTELSPSDRVHVGHRVELNWAPQDAQLMKMPSADETAADFASGGRVDAVDGSPVRP